MLGEKRERRIPKMRLGKIENDIETTGVRDDGMRHQVK